MLLSKLLFPFEMKYDFAYFVNTLPDWLTRMSGVITWPVLILVVCILTKRQLPFIGKLVTSKIADLTRISKDGFEFADPSKQKDGLDPENPALDSNKSESGKKPISNKSQDFRPEFYQYVSVDQIEPVVENFRKIFPDKEADYYLYLAAMTNIYLSHEKNYRLIYGSQIALLDNLNMGPVSYDHGKFFYDKAKVMFPEVNQHQPYESWLGFLTSISFIEHRGGLLYITPFGKGFLQYLANYGLPKNKQF